MTRNVCARRTALAGLAALALSACSRRDATDLSAESGPPSPSASSVRRDATPSSAAAPTEESTSLERRQPLSYEEVIASGPLAEEGAIRNSTWATGVRDRGTLVRGGTLHNPVFSISMSPDATPRGFDAGITQLLARYLLGAGGEEQVHYIESSVDTRESLLTSGSVDCVVATYLITEERRRFVDFAGPYYLTGTAIQVRTDDASQITSPADLAGRDLVTLDGSAGPEAIESHVPRPRTVQILPDNESCLLMLEEGRVDAYVCDQGILLRNVVADAAVAVVGEPILTRPYGIGLPRGGDAREFVDTFLEQMVATGTWTHLSEAILGQITSGPTPEPPSPGDPGSTL
ncbi:transporter substrate-binding domain-containing protein [Brachybacterium saurashtrense]|uniref:Amino acid-binding protein n=1 Tax=Brachybacterium saurashtrense TaxID=556288 RepID=A0A345YSX1_9MICO|nr:transporter substrate-binding domain-containing protein [Brachybacterium saurashtrense]AXK47023.1 amino acid-binding protein [Brachybacterium saurashtrense]RRR20872.1 amino acid-binding protein [Brachybacterium saurashtrense]